jgi:hypothetical protein
MGRGETCSKYSFMYARRFHVLLLTRHYDLLYFCI